MNRLPRVFFPTKDPNDDLVRYWKENQVFYHLVHFPAPDHLKSQFLDRCM